jgi:hypothetical protein
MSISGVANTGLLQQGNAVSPQQQWQRVLQVRQDFSQLALDLQSGDLADARKAYADLQTLQASSAGGISIPTDLAGLGQTLATNSLSEALTDSTLLQGDLSSALQNRFAAPGHRGHRHEDGSSQTGTTIDLTV